jgi:hypothetical protein
MMEHNEATARIVDLGSGVLDNLEEEALRKHAASCGDCAGVVEVLERLRAEAGIEGGAGGDSHASAEALAALAVSGHSPEEQATQALERHLAGCPCCRAELTVAREAIARVRSPLFRLGERVRALLPSGGVWGTPGPAWRALALVLLVPAVLGLWRMGNRPPSPQGGGVSVLFLAAPVRSAEGTIPTVRIRAGQALQPILVQATDPDWADLESDHRVCVRILRAEDSTAREVWAHAGSAASLIDLARAAIAVMVPTAVLSPGEYELSVEAEDPAGPPLSRRFRVAEASGG